MDKLHSNTFTGPDLCALTACDAVDLLKKGDVSPLEMLDAAYQRIDAVEPSINALPTLCRDRAVDAVGTLNSLEKDHPGYLAGLPIAIKDLSAVSGVRTTKGSIGFADFIPEQSSPIVNKLECRGGLIVGKSNTPELGAGANTFNAIFGSTRNPWDTSLNAGGSSGGAAASLATGEVWLSHGSDLAGSLRTPGAYCGVVGFRPSPGIAGGGPDNLRFHTEGVQGPMARTVRDCALFLDAMAGFDPLNPISFPPPEKSYQQSVLEADQNVRIAYTPDMNGFSFLSDKMDTHLRRALAAVERSGCAVEETCPELPGLDKTYRVLRAMLWAVGPGRAPVHIQKHYKQTLVENIEYGRNLSIDDVYDAQTGRSLLFDIMTNFFNDFDVLACPVVGLDPGPVEEEYPRELDGQPLDDYITWLKYSYLATATGLPALSVPVGLSSTGIPVGLQLIGSHRGEARLLQVARAIEVAVGGPLGPIDPNVTHG